MFKKILNIVKGWFLPAEKKDPHEELYLDIPKPDVPVYVEPCPIHRYFKAKCHMCVAAANGVNL